MAIIFVIVTTYVIVNLRRKLYDRIEEPEKIALQKHDESSEKNKGMVALCYLLGDCTIVPSVRISSAPPPAVSAISVAC